MLEQQTVYSKRAVIEAAHLLRCYTDANIAIYQDLFDILGGGFFK